MRVFTDARRISIKFPTMTARVRTSIEYYRVNNRKPPPGIVNALCEAAEWVSCTISVADGDFVPHSSITGESLPIRAGNVKRWKKKFVHIYKRALLRNLENRTVKPGTRQHHQRSDVFGVTARPLPL